MNCRTSLAALLLAAAGCRTLPVDTVTFPGNDRVSCSVSEQSADAVQQLREPRLQLHWAAGHRGDRDSGPDSTLPSFCGALRRGVPLIETDVRTAADGSLFLLHDKTVRAVDLEFPPSLAQRKTDSLTAAEIRLLKNHFPKTAPPSPVLFLSEALSLIRPYNAAFLLDLKHESTEQIDAIGRLVRAMNAERHIVVQCQQLQTLRYLKQHFPEIAAAIRIHTAADIAAAARYAPELYWSDYAFFSAEMITAIHARGSKVFEKSLGEETDDEAKWESRFKAGVDVLLSDHAIHLTKFSRKQFCPSSSIAPLLRCSVAPWFIFVHYYGNRPG
jgi:glycerophosphoryl diester phosphodiesterase